MKIERHSQIIRLISQYDIETQEELAEKLNESGFQVTQATVSRDIRELKLTKISKPGGGSRYAVLQSMDQEMSRKYTDVLRTSFQSMDLAQNILVVKTVWRWLRQLHWMRCRFLRSWAVSQETIH